MTDQNSSTSTTSQTGNDSTSTETEAKTPRKINNVEGLKSRTFRIPSHCETILQVGLDRIQKQSFILTA